MHRTDGMTNLAIIGTPGTGKTTLATALSEALGWTYVSAGDIARYADPVTRKTGAMANEDGFRRAFAKACDNLRGPAVFDGVPRSEGQLPLLPKGTLIILLTCRPDIARDRLIRRGRPDDEPQYVDARMGEQAELLDIANPTGWSWKAAGRECCLSTSLKSPNIIQRDVLRFLAGEQREVY